MPGCHTYVQQPGIRISGSSKPLFENEVLNRQILAGIPEDEIKLFFLLQLPYLKTLLIPPVIRRA